MRQNHKIVAASLGLVLTSAACQSGRAPAPQAADADVAPDPGVGPVSAMVAGPELTLGGGPKQAALAFSADGNGFRAGFLTHRARIEGGAVTMTPRHWDGSKTIDGAPIQLATRAVERGGVALTAALKSTAVVDGDLVLDRGAVVEAIENREDGLEQRWRFASQPDGDGDLAVAVAASGFASVVASKTGVHLANPGHLGVLYSNAVWTDSAGEAWDVPATWAGDHIALVVPAAVLDATVFPAVLDPTVTAELSMDTPTAGFTGNQVRELAVAFSGANSLAVWRDNRNGITSDIFASRISTAGTVLDSKGIAVNAAIGDQVKPTVAFAGGLYVVAWEDNGDIVAATVNPTTGAVIQLGTIAGTAAVETAPKLAAHGTDALLVWQSDTDVRAARFTAGAFGAPFDVTVTATSEIQPTVAANPAGDYLVLWTDGATAADIKGQLVTSAGALSGAALTISAGAGVQNNAAAAFDGTDFVATWNSGSDVFGGRISTAGAVLDTHLEGMTTVGGVSIAAQTSVQNQSAVACDSSQCLVSWSDQSAFATTDVDLHAQRFDVSFAPQGGDIALSTAIRSQILSALAPQGTGWLVVFQDAQSGGANVARGMRVDTAGAILDVGGFVMNRSNNEQSAPAYSRGASSQLAVWADSRVVGRDIMGFRFDSAGSKIGTTATAISNATGEQTAPSAAFDGTQYLVVWHDGRNPTMDIFGSRFTAAGVNLDPAGIPITTAAADQLVPDVASGGGNFLVVWQDRRNGGTFDIFGALLNAAGAVVVADIPICTVAGNQTRPAVTFDPVHSQFVVVWSDARTAGNAEIFGARLDTAGTVLDAGGVAITAAANGQFDPDVAVSGNQLLAVWEDRRADGNGDVFGARLTAGASLTVVDPGGLSIAAAAGAQNNPTVVGLQTGDFGIAWTDSRNSGVSGTDIFGGRVFANGAIDANFTIAANVADEDSPRFQNDANNLAKVNLMYSRLRTDLGVIRVQRRSITFEGSQGGTCTLNSQCLSGFCVDGFCCDQACGGTQSAAPRDCQACSVAHGAAVNGTCGVVITTTLICRGNPGETFCDAREFCDGVNPTCPPDLGLHGGQACTGTCGASVCPAADVSGAPHKCCP